MPHHRLITLLLSSLLLLTGCSDSSDNLPIEAGPLQILVTNDDGIDAPGIDALVNALLQMEDVEVTVVAPAENQSGSSDKTTDGEISYTDSSTASGYLGTAVFGFPADAVNVALDELGLMPDVVVSGANSGQNVGPVAALSGTVGAARTAARRGYPAVASSAGLGNSNFFGDVSTMVVDWLNANREALQNGTANIDTVTSFNVPECLIGDIRGLVQVPRAETITPGPSFFVTDDCTIEPDSDPIDDVDALRKGFAAETQVQLEFE